MNDQVQQQQKKYKAHHCMQLEYEL